LTLSLPCGFKRLATEHVNNQWHDMDLEKERMQEERNKREERTLS
jgi:hypothetical protein